MEFSKVAEEEFEYLNLGDKRLDERGKKILSAFLK